LSHNPLVLGIDLEGINADLMNSGVNLQTDRVIEIGAVLWDWTLSQPVKIYSELINEADRLPLSEEVVELTGITEQMLTSQWSAQGKKEITQQLQILLPLIEKADYLMAHNGKNYDIPMLSALFERCELAFPDKVWIDTMTDIEYPRKIKIRSMSGLEHAHGFINPFPHRAVTDVLSMLKVAANYSFDRMTKLAKSPIVRIVAPLSPPNWKKTEEVEAFNIIKNKISKSRFRWDPKTKKWSKEVHKVLVDEGKLKFDFEWFISE